MTLLERIKLRRRARQEVREKLEEKSARGFEKGVKLEKGDFIAIMISGFFCFVLPIMLVIGAVCGLAYLYFTRF